jgi:hypothetical protein
MRYKPEIKELINWLKIEQNTMVKLAGMLGYKSCSTIGKWIKDNKIPLRPRNQVLAIIRGEKTNVTTQSNNEG